MAGTGNLPVIEGVNVENSVGYTVEDDTPLNIDK